MKRSEEIYVIEDILALNRVLSNIYDGSYIEDGYITKDENTELGALIEGVLSKMEYRFDE